MAKRISAVILFFFLFGCGTGMTELRREEAGLDLVVRTCPTGADVFVNSDYIGKSPAKTHIPCEVFIQDKGTPTFTQGAIYAATVKGSLGIMGYGLCTPAAVFMWPYGFLMGVVAKDQGMMLLPVTVMKRIPECVEEMKVYYERAERTKVVRVVPRDASGIELSAEWDGRVGRRTIDLGWFIKDPVALSSGDARDVTLILETEQSGD